MTASLTRKELYDLVWSRPMASVAKDLGISGAGLSKICDRVLVPYPPRGHWARAQDRRGSAPSLPSHPGLDQKPIVVSADRSPSRRKIVRLAPEARREQLLSAAAELITREGLAAVSMKAVARKVGISEALAHNYFSRRRDLLLELALREFTAMESIRRNEMSRGQDHFTRIMLSTLAYLQQVSERGVLIQILINSAEVRDGLRQTRDDFSLWDRQRITGYLRQYYAVPEDVAQAVTVVLTAVTVRAGRLIAAGKLPLSTAQRLTLRMVTDGTRQVIDAHADRD